MTWAKIWKFCPVLLAHFCKIYGEAPHRIAGQKGFFSAFFRNDTMRRSHILQCDIATFKAPFIYYVITCRGGGSENANFWLHDYMVGRGGPKILKMRLRNIWMVPKAWRIVPGIPWLSKLSVFFTKLYKSSHGQCGHLSDVEMLVSR